MNQYDEFMIRSILCLSFRSEIQTQQ